MPEVQAQRLVKRKKQLHFIRPAQMALFARVVSWPPLGQVTIVPHEQSEVSALSAPLLRDFVSIDLDQIYGHTRIEQVSTRGGLGGLRVAQH